jgi:glycosyltransferase involved in cell wall biosynthesis
VIASNVSDIAEYLADGRDAIIVRPDSASALAEGIRRLTALPDRGRSIGRSGRERCLSCFHYQLRCREIDAFLQHVIDAGLSRRPTAASACT